MSDDLTPLSGALRNEAANTEGELSARLRRLADRAAALEDSFYDTMANMGEPYVEISELVYADTMLPAIEFKEAVVDIVTRPDPPIVYGARREGAR
jgi:hypothetical protein